MATAAAVLRSSAESVQDQWPSRLLINGFYVQAASLLAQALATPVGGTVAPGITAHFFANS